MLDGGMLVGPARLRPVGRRRGSGARPARARRRRQRDDGHGSTALDWAARGGRIDVMHTPDMDRRRAQPSAARIRTPAAVPLPDL